MLSNRAGILRGVAETFGDRIRTAREEKRLSVGELAPRVGITESALRKIESGETGQPRYNVGIKLAYALDLNPLYLAFGDESFRTESGSHLGVDVLAALERLSARTAAQDQRVSNLEAQVADVLKRITRG